MMLAGCRGKVTFDDLLRAYPPLSQAKWARLDMSPRKCFHQARIQIGLVECGHGRFFTSNQCGSRHSLPWASRGRLDVRRRRRSALSGPPVCAQDKKFMAEKTDLAAQFRFLAAPQLSAQITSKFF